MAKVRTINLALTKQSEQARSVGKRLASAHLRGFEADRVRMERLNTESTRWMIEKARVPFETRDVLIEMNQQLIDMRAEEARRDRAARVRDGWMLLLTAAILVLTALLVLELFHVI